MKLFIKLHSIIGSILSIMFVIWFFSGIVLIFQGFPHASKKERFLNLSQFNKENIQNIKSPSTQFKGTTTLELYLGKAIYRVKNGRKTEKIYDAYSLKSINSFSKAQAKKLVLSFTKDPIKDISIEHDLNQWIPWSYYEALLPFYKFSIDDSKHTEIFISKKTGSIIQTTTRKKRLLSYIGAIPHWIYFVQLRRYRDAWGWVVIVLASFGLILSISGIIVGIYRKKEKGITPYKKFWFKWHHWFGFFFGIFVFTFILSGLFSMFSIPNWMVGVNKHKITSINWDQKSKIDTSNNVSPIEIWNALENKEGVRKIEWHTVFDNPSYFIYYNNYQAPVVYKKINDTIIKTNNFTLNDIKQRANKLYPKLTATISVQNEYDNYYSGSSMYYWPKPAYKIEFNDEKHTWLYINPATGTLLKKYTKNSRLGRWIYSGLHTLNFQYLKEHNTLRIVILIILCLLGLVISISGLVLSKKFFTRRKK